MQVSGRSSVYAQCKSIAYDRGYKACEAERKRTDYAR